MTRTQKYYHIIYVFLKRQITVILDNLELHARYIFLIKKYIAVKIYVKIIYFAFMISYFFYLENSVKTAYLKTSHYGTGEK